MNLYKQKSIKVQSLHPDATKIDLREVFISSIKRQQQIKNNSNLLPDLFI